MKKSYIIGILLVILLGAISFLATYNYSKNELLTDKLYEEQTKEQLVTVNNAPVDVITNKTKLIIEKYNKENNTLEEEYIIVPSKLLGLNREELIKYLKQYENNPDYHDIDDGFSSIDLLSFSTECVVIRKTYVTNRELSKYYLKSEDGYVTVYYSDLKTVYCYSDILINSLPTKLQEEITNGKYIKDIEELFNFLESYSIWNL